MKTFKFEELDQRGKDAAIKRYEGDPEVETYIAMSDITDGKEEDVIEMFTALKWRFNEHGERIA